MISPKFAKKLNDSSWMGTIFEAGFGVPFQAGYLEIPGASNTILATGCNYNKAFNPTYLDGKGGVVRTVSKEAARHFSKEKALMSDHIIRKDIEKWSLGGASAFTVMPPIFALTVTGSHTDSNSRSGSHGWVDLCAVIVPGSNTSEPVVAHYSFHFFNHKLAHGTAVTREMVGADLCRFIEWFIEMVLLRSWDTWDEAIDHMPLSSIVKIDVIDANLSVEEHLKLVEADTPLVYADGWFQRPVDYLRKYDRIYRGSFNPVTVGHLTVGEGALYELAIDNARKGANSLKEIAARLWELRQVEVPVLITKGCPTFVSFDHLVSERSGGKTFKYLVGADTFNAIVDDKFCPTKHYLGQFYGDVGSSFLVVPRNGVDIVSNERANLVAWEEYDPGYDRSISSTRVRNGELDLVPKPIREHVAKRFGIKDEQ